jgi:hypothetical protein
MCGVACTLFRSMLFSESRLDAVNVQGGSAGASAGKKTKKKLAEAKGSLIIWLMGVVRRPSGTERQAGQPPLIASRDTEPTK